MKLTCAVENDELKSCTLAMRLAGISLSPHRTEPSQPIITLALDSSSHPEEIMGELSICRFLCAQCPWPQTDTLALEEWFVYELKPRLSTTDKKSIKSNTELLGMIGRLETSLTSTFLAGEKPGAIDVLAVAHLHQHFSGNPWMVKTYPKLSELFNQIRDLWDSVIEHFGGKLAAAKQKGKQTVLEKVVLERTLTPSLPSSETKNILITSALPYVNNVPHLGNLIGCVLSADVYARYCRLRGYNTLYICGTDEYGTATETKAIKENTTPQAVCDKYFVIHKAVYEWFDIDFDYFGRTTTPQQTEISQGIFMKLNKNEELFTDEVQQFFCNTCNRFLADRFVNGTCPYCQNPDARGDQCDACSKLLNPEDLVNPVCFLCSNTPEIKTSKHMFINLPNIKDRLVEWIDSSSEKGKWSNNCMGITQAWIKEGLKPRCITRDLKWGVQVPLPDFSNKVFYVWFDAPIGYLSITANYTSEWEAWWKNPDNVELIQFMGKDNVPFHTVVFPSTLIGTQDRYTMLSTISTTEYLNYEGGKFSKTHSRGVFGDDAINSGIPSEIYRFYLLASRPEQSDTDFKWKDLQTKINNQLMPNLGNFCNRVLQTLSKLDRDLGTPNNLEDNDREYLGSFYEIVQNYCSTVEELKIKTGLEIALKASSLGNKYLQEQKMWEIKKSNPERFQTILVISANMVRATGLLVEPYIPGFSAKLYTQLRLERTPREQVLLKEIIDANDPAVLLTLLPSSLRVTQAAPIIMPIRDEEIKSLKERFG